MRFWIGVTDGDWYRYLAARPELDEVNFWQPTAGRAPGTFEPGTPFLFKLHARDGGFIVGGGYVARPYATAPIYLAWEAFETKNGAATEDEMLRRIQRYRGGPIRIAHDEIGCTILGRPFFLPREQWVRPPDDWAPNIVQGKWYGDEDSIGARVWHDLTTATARVVLGAVAEERYGTPVSITPRLGQGGFRFSVTEAYGRRCAMTAERTLPALDAAHIIPYSKMGEHRVDNGLLLRKDLHALFDAGYVGVSPDMRILVSRRIREDFENGRDYYALAGRSLHIPTDLSAQPNPAYLAWHSTERFLD